MIADGSNRIPNPEVSGMCIDPSATFGPSISIPAQSGSRSGLAKHSTDIPCGWEDKRCDAICGSS